MIRIKPTIDHRSQCPNCAAALEPGEILWQGIHVCVRSTCKQCGHRIAGDLPVGHAIDGMYQVDLDTLRLVGPDERRVWFGEPLLQSLRSPKSDAVPFRVVKFAEAANVVIVNCIDYLYGHSLLKLLNVERHLREAPELGVVVIVPAFLAWLIPDGVAEAWIADIPLSRAQNFYPDLDKKIRSECDRFETVFVSRALSHPRHFDLVRFTKISRHDFHADRRRVTYIWREDRTWESRPFAAAVLRRLRLGKLLAWSQKRKVVSLFEQMRKSIPDAAFGVAGLGTSGRFPSWIEDHRVSKYSEEIERRHCELYAASRLVIGVHGSNMLLPSGLSGLTIDLMPEDRWGNFGQDILYQVSDSRMASFQYRFLPISVSVQTLAAIAVRQMLDYEEFARHMLMDGENR
jgi:hypothetical protein